MTNKAARDLIAAVSEISVPDFGHPLCNGPEQLVPGSLVFAVLPL